MSERTKGYALGADEKATPVMVYTPTHLCWGEVITKEMVRVSTYLRTLNPDFVSLRDARALPIGGPGPGQPVAFPELHIRTPHVIALHLLPPASEGPDYDPAETNRKMEPVTVLVGPYRFDANIRMSAILELQKFLDITSEVYLSLYDAVMSCPIAAAIKPLRAPMVLIRRDACGFAPRR